MRLLAPTNTWVCLLTVACGYFAMPVHATSSNNEVVPQRIQLGDDVLAGYQQSLKKKKPLVIVFVCPMEQQKCVHCKRFRKSLTSKRLDRFADQAIFVLSEIDVRNQKRSDGKAAKALFDRLEMTATPAVTVLEPNPKVLAELGGMRGYFDSKKLVQHLGEFLDKWYDDPTLTPSKSDESNKN